MARSLKSKTLPFGRMLEYVATLTDDEKARAAIKSQPGIFGEDVIKFWPSREALHTTIRMQNSGPRKPDHWRPVVAFTL